VSAYAQEGSAGGSPYAQGAGSGGSPYAGGSATVKAKAKSSGGGIFGFVSKIPGAKAVEGGVQTALGKTASVADSLGTGVYDIAKSAVAPPDVGWGTVGHQWEDLLLHGKLDNQQHDPLAANVKAIAKSTATSVEHPLRDPVQTAITALMLLSGGASTAAKIGYASKALNAARVGDTGALVLQGSDAAKAAEAAGHVLTPLTRAEKTKLIAHTVSPLGKVPTAPRFLNVPKLTAPEGEGPAALSHTPVQLQASGGHLYRAVQSLHDTLAQRALDAGLTDANPTRLAKHANKLVAGSVAEGSRVTANIRAADAARVAQASKLVDKGVSQRAAQLAMFLRSANVTGAEAAKYWRDQAAAGIGAKVKIGHGIGQRATAVLAKTAQDIHDNGILHLGEDGNVQVDAVKYPKLHAADQAVSVGQAAREKIIKDYGLMTPEALQTRLDLVGKKMAGATFVKPTPGKLGVPSQGLLRQRTLVERLQTLHDRASGKAAGAAEAAVAKLEPAASPQEIVGARTRLARLEAQHEGALDTIAAGMFGPADKREVAYRNVENAKTKRAAAGVPRGLTPQAHAAGVQRTFEARVAANNALTAARNAGATPEEISNLETQYELAKSNERLAHSAKIQKPLSKESRARTAPKLKPTVKAEQRALAEKAVNDAIAKNPEHPTLKAWQRRVEAIDQLKATLNPPPEEVFSEDGAPAVTRVGLGKEPVAAAVGSNIVAPGKVVAATGSARAERLGAALSVAKDRLAQMERAAYGHVNDKGEFVPGRKTQTGIVGGETARPGQGFVTLKTSVPRAPSSPIVRSSGSVIPLVKRLALGKTATGAGVAEGLIPAKTSLAVARALHEALRFVNSDELRGKVAALGSDVKRTIDDILVRDPAAAKAGKISTHVQELLGRSESTVTTPGEDTLRSAGRKILESHIPGLEDNFAADRAAGIGERAPAGFKWVPRQLVPDDLTSSVEPRGSAEKFANTVNSAVTAATVYFKLGHLPTRLLTNLSTNLVQGSLSPHELGKSVTLAKELSDSQKLDLTSVTGTHGYMALPHAGAGKIAAAATSGAGMWARHVDAPFRLNSVLYELRQIGIDTPEKIDAAIAQLKDPARAGMNAVDATKLDWAVRRANRAAIMYDGLSAAEKRYVARYMWFYPWTKGAARFAGHTLTEHPVKATAIEQTGVLGANDRQQQLGNVPPYELGLTPLTGGPSPLTANFSSFTPYSTVAQLAQMAQHPLNPDEGVFGQLNPVYSGLWALHDKGLAGAAGKALEPTPEYQVLTGGLNPPGPTKMFGTTDVGAPFGPGGRAAVSGLLRALGGAVVPRPTRKSVLNKTAHGYKAIYVPR
jgi:hypothetical protein